MRRHLRLDLGHLGGEVRTKQKDVNLVGVIHNLGLADCLNGAVESLGLCHLAHTGGHETRRSADTASEENSDASVLVCHEGYSFPNKRVRSGSVAASVLVRLGRPCRPGSP